MISNNLENTLTKALSIATKKHHEYATYEHLLLALIADAKTKKILLKYCVDVDLLSIKLEKYLEDNSNNLISRTPKNAIPATGFQRVVQRAVLHSQAMNNKVITGLNVVAEFFFESDSFALSCLKESNLDHRTMMQIIKAYNEPTNHYVDHKNLSSFTLSHQTPLTENLKSSIDIDKTNDNEKNELEKYCINLNKRANIDSIDCLIGRQNEVQRTIEILCRRKKNNAILVGEPGVGKTAIAEGMAIRIVKNDVPNLLKNTIIYSLDIGTLVAGTKFRGDFENRIKKILKELRESENVILFIDEIHNIIGAGATQAGALDASNLLKPALAKGELRCIGSTTFKEYTDHFEKDAALVRRFQKIVITEPTEEETFEILKGIKSYYEKHHNVIYTDSALKSAISLSMRYINDRHLPDKAIDLIDEVGSRNILTKNKKKQNTITNKDVEELLSTILKVPEININDNETKKLKKLESNLQKYIFGQDQAIKSLCASIKLSIAGLRSKNRPTGCYLFAGPSGVGKTELAKQLSIFSDMKLIKLDMSEFAESNSISKLLGSAPGYVGFNQSSTLASEIDKHPYSVVVFDEIEKADPGIFNLLLQIMDEGQLTNSSGKKINFSHSIIILTANITEPNKMPIGFGDNPERSNIMKEINDIFSPELCSRFDNIICFNPIDGIIAKIVNKSIKDLKTQLADKNLDLVVNPSVKKYLTQMCFNETNGARELNRIIDKEIKQIIADEILFGKLKNGGTANVDFVKKKQKIIFEFINTKTTQTETS